MNGRLAPCPSTPNCVSSDAPRGDRKVEPFRLTAPSQEAWEAVRDILRTLPRTDIVAVNDGYAHAIVHSRIFRFVDDLELRLRPEEGIIAVRSASRTGYWDLGVNRDRVATLRAALLQRSVIEVSRVSAPGVTGSSSKWKVSGSPWPPKSGDEP